MERILITGGAGFIGSHIALKLLRQGRQVTVLDNLSPQIHGENPDVTSPLYRSIKDKVRFIHGDVRSRADWETALEGVSAVIHLAAETVRGSQCMKLKNMFRQISEVRQSCLTCLQILLTV